MRLICAIGVACTFGFANAATNVIELERDAGGNITKIKRQAAAVLSVTGFTPASGAIGASVTVYGSGFGALAGDNVVKFNGVAATVSAVGTGSLAVNVPAGATDGKISVTVGGSTAASGQDFVVVSPDTPTITSFTPTSGAASTSVSVTGTGFASTGGATTVKLNGVSAVASIIDATSLSFTVPANTASGRITATTAAGTGASSTDFLVPPPGISLSNVVQAVRVTMGGSAVAVTVASPGKSALVLFDGAANAFHTIQLGQLAISPSSATVPYSVVKPDNTVLISGVFGGSTNRPTIHLPKLPADGTYALVVSPGSATFNANIRVGADPIVAIDGSGAPSNLNSFYQSARFVFDANASQRLGVGIGGIASTPTGSANLNFKVYRPDGTQLTTPDLTTCNGPDAQNLQGNCDGEIVTSVAGRYTIVGETASTNYSNFSVYLSNDATGTLEPDVASDVILARVGQDARFTFAGAAGDFYGLDLSGINPLPQSQQIAVIVLKPDGVTSLASATAVPPGGAYLELGPLPTSGTYTVWIDPRWGTYGSAKLTLKQGPMLAASDSPTSFTAASTAETARFRFSASAGDNLAIGVTGLTYVGSSSATTTLNVVKPDKSSLGSFNCNPIPATGTCKVTIKNLAATGTYAVTLQPPAGIKISANVLRSDDVTGTLASGVAQTITGSRAGQSARYTFSGAAGDSTSLRLFGLVTTPAGQAVNAYLTRPDGVQVGTFNVLAGNSSSILNLPSLPSTGTYTVAIEPVLGITWQAQLMLDPGTLVTPDDPATTLSTNTGGEPLRFRVNGTAGQRVEFGIGGLAYTPASSLGTNVNIYKPDGSPAGSTTCATSGVASCEIALGVLTTTGTYSVVIAPPTANTLSGGTMAISTPATGTLVIGGGSQTIAVTRPGQTARWTFTGTAGQLLRLNWTAAFVSGGQLVNFTILKPDGTTLGSNGFVNGSTSGYDIPSLPTTGTYIVVYDPTSASTISVPTTLVTR